MKLWHSIDNYFNEKEIEEIFTSIDTSTPNKSWYLKDNLCDFQKKLLEGSPWKSDKVFGVEQWFHTEKTVPGMHYDKDEELFVRTQEIKFPIASAILYLKVEDLLGGKLFINDNTPPVSPKTGQVIYLAPGVLHGVLRHIRGVRRSININIWDYNINIDNKIRTIYR